VKGCKGDWFFFLIRISRCPQQMNIRMVRFYMSQCKSSNQVVDRITSFYRAVVYNRQLILVCYIFIWMFCKRYICSVYIFSRKTASFIMNQSSPSSRKYSVCMTDADAVKLFITYIGARLGARLGAWPGALLTLSSQVWWAAKKPGLHIEGGFHCKCKRRSNYKCLWTVV